MKSKYITEKLLNRVFNNELCENGKEIISLFKEKKIFLNNKLDIYNTDEIEKGKKCILKYIIGNSSFYLGVYYHSILMCMNEDIADKFELDFDWSTSSFAKLTKYFNTYYIDTLTKHNKSIIQ